MNSDNMKWKENGEWFIAVPKLDDHILHPALLVGNYKSKNISIHQEGLVLRFVSVVCFFDGCFSVVFSLVFFFAVGRLNLGIALRRNSDLQG